MITDWNQIDRALYRQFARETAKDLVKLRGWPPRPGYNVAGRANETLGWLIDHRAPVELKAHNQAGSCLAEAASCMGYARIPDVWNMHSLYNWLWHRAVLGRSRDEVRALIQGGNQPPLAPIFEGRWSGNFLYGPSAPNKPYFTPACLSWSDAHFQAVIDWTVAQGLTHLVVNPTMDNWGAARGHAEWTTGGAAYDEASAFRWYRGDTLKTVVIPRLIRIREAGLIPVCTLIEHKELKEITKDRAIARGVELAGAIAEHTGMFVAGWEWDEIYPNSAERWEFEKDFLRAVKVRAGGRDIGIHYSAKKALEGSGLDVQGGWNNAYPGHVVKLYQSERNAGIETVRDECRILADVSRQRGTKLCMFEASGSDAGIGSTYSIEQANQRAQAGVTAARQYLPPERTGSMNGKVSL